ncbi:U-box domain protein [Legionella santicrucis]|uniref:U-box domain protein n=1 Tax=Legionella santicrucis TaxID=45074 RepID=A0A0W0ZM32_9GAMM|nr:U-box domain-containing protein [Legionella santicrucis]KTD69977.1 U-box domain protein [Legionella santicrucis]
MKSSNSYIDEKKSKILENIFKQGGLEDLELSPYVQYSLCRRKWVLSVLEKYIDRSFFSNLTNEQILKVLDEEFILREKKPSFADLIKFYHGDNLHAFLNKHRNKWSKIDQFLAILKVIENPEIKTSLLNENANSFITDCNSLCQLLKYFPKESSLQVANNYGHFIDSAKKLSLVLGALPSRNDEFLKKFDNLITDGIDVAQIGDKLYGNRLDFVKSHIHLMTVNSLDSILSLFEPHLFGNAWEIKNTLVNEFLKANPHLSVFSILPELKPNNWVPILCGYIENNFQEGIALANSLLGSERSIDGGYIHTGKVRYNNNEMYSNESILLNLIPKMIYPQQKLKAAKNNINYIKNLSSYIAIVKMLDESNRMEFIKCIPEPAQSEVIKAAQAPSIPIINANALNSIGMFAPKVNSQSKEIKIPKVFICPLTKKMMHDPVIFKGDFNTYERSAITQYLELYKKSPLTEDKMQPGQKIADVLKSDSKLAESIEEFKVDHPELFYSSPANN